MNKEKTFNLRIYRNENIEAEGFNATAEGFFITAKNIKRYYNIEANASLDYRTVDFSNFADSAPDSIYLGREISKVFEKGAGDLVLFNAVRDKETESTLAKNFKYYFMFEKGDKFYSVFYSEDGAGETDIQKVMKYYEKNTLLWKKLNLLKFENYGYYIEIPNIGIRRYFAIVRDKYLVYTNDGEYLKNISAGRYNDVNYSKIDTNVTYDYNYKLKISRNIYYRDKEVEETISIANSN